MKILISLHLSIAGLVLNVGSMMKIPSYGNLYKRPCTSRVENVGDTR